jgi:hypothetical protein
MGAELNRQMYLLRGAYMKRIPETFLNFLFRDSIKILFLLCLLSCSKQNKGPETLAKNDAAIEGGVDGSGGNLKTLTREELNSFIENELPYFIRNIIHRLKLIQKNKETTEDDSVNSIKQEKFFNYLDDFLGRDAKQINDIAKSVQYKVKDECYPDNHHNIISDAAVSDTAVVCFSFRTFSKLPKPVLNYKLIAISMHELSHLRGFTEQEASEWQSYFELKEFNSKVFRFANEPYKEVKRDIQKGVGKIALALNALGIHNHNETRINNACQLIKLGTEILNNINHLSDLSLVMPKHLKEIYWKTILGPLSRLNFGPITVQANPCNEKDIMSLGDKLEKIILSSIAFTDQLIRYESPICRKNLCGFLRDHVPEISLLNWQLFKPLQKSKKSAPETEIENIRCTLKDIQNQEFIDLIPQDENNSFSFTDKKTKVGRYQRPYSGVIQIEKEFDPATKTHSSYVNIRLIDNSLKKMTEPSGMHYLDPLWIEGKLQKGSIEIIISKFKLLNDSDGSYHMGNTFYSIIKKAPNQLNEYELKCDLL